MGWVSQADCLTAPREIGFDASLSQLLSNPIRELEALRGERIGVVHSTPLRLQAGESATLFDRRGESAHSGGEGQ